MIVYVDTSALLKRVFDESETASLRDRLEELVGQGATLISSALTSVELSRALLHRSSATNVDWLEGARLHASSGVLDRAIDEEVIALARRVGSKSLRSLDAIHCATAVLSDVDLVISYDQRLLAAIEETGIRGEAPSAIQR